MQDGLDIRDARHDRLVSLDQCAQVLDSALRGQALAEATVADFISTLCWHARSHDPNTIHPFLDRLELVSSDHGSQLLGVLELVKAHMAYGRDEHAAAHSLALSGRAKAVQKGNEFVASCCCRLAANTQYRLGQYGEARTLLEECIVAARRSHDRRLEALALSDLALVDKNQGALGASELRLSEALTIFERLGMRLDAARCELNLGNVYHRLGHWDKSLYRIERAMASFEELGHERFADTARIALGRGLRFVGEAERAKTTLSYALGRAENSGSRRHAILAHEFLGDFLYDSGRVADALFHYEIALADARRIGSESDLVVECTRRTADALSTLGRDLPRARALADESVALARAQEDAYELAHGLLSLGGVLNALGKTDEAVAAIQDALVGSRACGNSFVCGRAALAQSQAAHLTGDHVAAVALALEAKRELSGSQGNPWYVRACEWFDHLASALAVSTGSPRHRVIARGVASPFLPPGFQSVDPKLCREFETLAKLAHTNLNILVLGESGTGKELVASGIHKASNRTGPFVPVNCSALPGELLEGELFGHARGAYTGADRERNGLIEYSHKGTLFLDEIGDMPVKAQARLLRALESGEIRRLGENSPRVVDLRVVAATHRNLLDMVSAGEFRLDLYYRLAGYVLRIPPVRDRDGDAAILIDHFLNLFATEQDKRVALDPDLRQELIHYSWPGNVREIRNVMQRIVSLVEHGHTLKRLPFDLDGGPQPRSLPEALEAEERKRIVDALRTANGNKSAAARLLGASRTTLIGKMKRLGIEGADNTTS